VDGRELRCHLYECADRERGVSHNLHKWFGRVLTVACVDGGRSRSERRASTMMRSEELVSTLRKDVRYTILIARHLGEAVIQQIRSTRPGYNLISNNCQTYVLQLLDAIRVSQVKEFGTTLAVYQRLFGTGKVSDLFMDEDGNLHPNHLSSGVTVEAPLEGQEVGVISDTVDHSSVLYHHPEALLHQNQDNTGGPTKQNSILFAQQVMNANTTQLNAEEEMQRGINGHTQIEPKKERSWSEKTNSLLGRFKR
jgi:hypothetical protein